MKDKFAKIGKVVHYDINGLSIDVTVLDYKNSYGNDRWLITPVNGSGETWVERLDFDS